MRAAAIAGFVLKSADPARLARFYVEALGFVVEREAQNCIRLRLGAPRLEIEAANGRPYPDDVPGASTLFQHFAIATSDIRAAYDRLRTAGFRQGDPTCNPPEGGGHASPREPPPPLRGPPPPFAMGEDQEGRAATDPPPRGGGAGPPTVVEGARPGGSLRHEALADRKSRPDAGGPRWRPISRDGPVTLPASSGGVTAFKFRDPEGHPLELIQFPGDRGGPRIDHTAISVADRARSLAWYEALGFSVSGGSLNQGPTQAALDGLEGPVVDIVALAPPQARPHLELLAYRAPPRRADPPPALDDIAATRIILRCTDDPPSTSPLQDPDGHWLQWESRQDAR